VDHVIKHARSADSGLNVINEVGAMPTRNHRDVQFEGAKDISAEAMLEPRKTDGKANLVTNQACLLRPLVCRCDQGLD
jgi:aldehyde:ferredoxin oxidoreductase